MVQIKIVSENTEVMVSVIKSYPDKQQSIQETPTISYGHRPQFVHCWICFLSDSPAYEKICPKLNHFAVPSVGVPGTTALREPSRLLPG